MASGGKSRSKRNFDPVSLSFLDVISCGFGAIVLIFLITKHSPALQVTNSDPAAAEVSLLDEEVREGREGLVRARNTLAEIDDRLATAQGLARRIQEQLDPLRVELTLIETDADTEEETVSTLKTEIAKLEAELARLKAEEEKRSGNNIRAFVGEGNRQYLTGLILGGNRILILVDTSASMLDNTIVNILRRRNMSDADKKQAPKWVHVQKTVDWLTSRLPPPSQYQIYAFNNEVSSLIPGTEGTWLEVADEEKLNQSVENLNNTIPSQGTNLENVFVAIKNLDPLPDNIFLITDGLPTLENRGDAKGLVSGRDREKIFERALKELPKDVPFNVILEPLEGDPMAASFYWQLSVTTKGSFLTPSADWP
jgi:polyhydroxyalkanoate synthesis regulator phasin